MPRNMWRRFWGGQPHDPYARGIVYAIGTEEWLGFVRVKFPDRGNLISWWLNVGVRKTQNDKDWWIPDVGEMVTCLMDRDYENGTVLCSMYSSADVPPEGATVNQRIIEFSDGAVIKYDRSAHALTANLPAGATAAISAPGGLTANQVQIDSSGNITTPGKISAGGDVVAGSISLQQHVHPGVQSGSSNTGQPTG
jgi:phage baseplate assembly protein V